MQTCLLIFINSLRAAFMLPMGSESGWFAARSFGDYNMTLLTVVAFAGSLAGMGINYGIGYYLAYSRRKTMFNEQAYNRIQTIFNKYIIWIFLFPPFPLLGILASMAGLFHLPARKLFGLIIIGRIAYYSYYLLH